MRLSELARALLELYNADVFEENEWDKALITDMLFNSPHLRGNHESVVFRLKGVEAHALHIEFDIDDDPDEDENPTTYDPLILNAYTVMGYHNLTYFNGLRVSRGVSPRDFYPICDGEPQYLRVEFYRVNGEGESIPLTTWYETGA